MNKRLYVGNLSYDTLPAQLEEAFAGLGVTCVTLPLDQRGRCKEFGFVDLEEGRVEAAIQAMDGQILVGRPIRVNEARSDSERGGKTPRSGYVGRGDK